VFLGFSGGLLLEHYLTFIARRMSGFSDLSINLFSSSLAFFRDFSNAFIILPMVAPIAPNVLTPVVVATQH